MLKPGKMKSSNRLALPPAPPPLVDLVQPDSFSFEAVSARLTELAALSLKNRTPP
jgi:hypothetical protein